jgi:hypothetical protein
MIKINRKVLSPQFSTQIFIIKKSRFQIQLSPIMSPTRSITS